jgi:plastocyanin
VSPAGRARARAGLALLAAAAFVAAAGCGPGRAPKVYRVTIQGFTFNPAALAAAPGDTVVFTNADVLPHTATRDGGGWDSGPIAAGAAWKLAVQGGAAGPYHCTFHPTMKARLDAAK